MMNLSLKIDTNQMPDGLVEMKREEPTPIVILNNDNNAPIIDGNENGGHHPLGPWIPVKKKEEAPPKLTE